LLILCVNSERREHLLLQLPLVNTNAAAADFHPVKNDVVRLGTDVWKCLGLKQRHVLRFRSCEWMMHGVPFVFLRAPFKERKICYPQKVPDFSGRGELLHFCDAQPYSAENFASDFPSVGGEKHAIAFLDLQFGY